MHSIIEGGDVMQASRASLINVCIAAVFIAAAALAAPARALEPDSCAASSDCAMGEFCDTSPKCPGNGARGVCRRKPSVCTDQYLPVTGCNGRVYSNACVAASDGQPHTGPVKKPESSSENQKGRTSK
jgi:hypothetical protein